VEKRNRHSRRNGIVIMSQYPKEWVVGGFGEIAKRCAGKEAVDGLESQKK
jgi:hypothetical protein